LERSRKERTMEKRLDCGDIGMECDYRVCASTDEETIRKVGEHIQAFHGMKGFSKEFYEKARAAVHSGSCEAPKDCSGSICRL
jgi:predicted small metal-binding protein